ncbi:MAG: hypothetical protein WCT06_01270 [Armatimonadota bacterium]|jgi:type II secretory pathway pseudopilin PulG|nr:hypothetical protein [Armatimonadota bacterium]
MLRDNKGQWSLIGLIVVVVIIGIMGYYLLPGLGGSTSVPAGNINGTSAPATPGGVGSAPSPMDRAKGLSCQSNLRQVRDAINMYKQGNEKAPEALSNLSSYGVSGEVGACPQSKSAYSYDAASGRVWCSTPGHENF